MKKSLKLILNFTGMAVIAAALIVGNIILFRYDNQISSLLTTPIVNEEAYGVTSQEGQELSSQIMEEGAVLLRNENNTLPLSKTTDTQVNVFGWHSVDWIYGSVGRNASGGVRPEDGDFSKNVDLYKALEDYGISYNTELYNMYLNYFAPYGESAVASSSHISEFMRLCEPSISEDTNYYTESLLNNALEYSDTALVVISRMTGESGNPLDYKEYQPKEGPNGDEDDYSRHYLQLSTEEIELLTYVGANYDKTIVIVNSANVMELGELETIEGIDAALMVGFTGTRAASAIPSLLYGDTSPSGKTTDTYSYDLLTNPANYFTDKTFSNYSRTYIDYLEGIYVGYKWYETADVEGYWDNINNQYGQGYEGVVQYPFGFGLSYTTFDWEITDISINEGDSFTDEEEITFTINVTNTGDYVGRDVVEIYVETPYTNGEIEKSAVQLAGYEKTHEIAPGGMETITISIDPYDFASYDCYDLNNNDFKGYELEAGNYNFSFRTDSHTVRTVEYEGEERDGIFTFNVSTDILIEVDPETGNTVSNLFTGEDSIDDIPIDGTSKDGSYDPDIPWFTRSSFHPLEEWEAMDAETRAVTPGADRSGTSIFDANDAEEWDTATIDSFGEAVNRTYPTWGANYGITLAENGIVTEDGEQLGANYDDALWEDVLDQLTFDEALSLINNYYGTNAINSVGKPELDDYDGPSQILGFSGLTPRGTGYPAISVLGATWNKRLAYDFGKSFGNEMSALSINGLWGWAIDSHRSAWFGRNNESPSEDPLLAGLTIANAVDGLSKAGRYCTLKHFALYGASGDSIWLSEQALREVYLKPFREAIVEGGALGIMTTYQGIGAEHSETTEGLLTGVLRKEWDFKGMAVTDYVYTDEYLEAFVRVGGDLGMNLTLGTYGTYTAQSASPRLQNKIREICKHVLYTWLRSDYNYKQYVLNPDDGDTIVSQVSISGWDWWHPLVYTLDAIICVEIGLWAALLLLNTFWKEKDQAVVVGDQEPLKEEEASNNDK